MSVETDDGHGHGHGHHLPAVEDWPKGFGEASWWPFIAALGGSGLYIGAALFVLGQPEHGVVSPLAGPLVFVLSTAAFLAGLYGWLYHAFIVDFWAGEADDHGFPMKLTMLLFLGTEVATFGAGFVYYFFIRADAWANLPPIVADGNVLNALVIANTLILIASSVTMHYAHHALLKDNRKRFVRLLGATLLLGLIFLAGQTYEYYEFITVYGFGLTDGAYGSAFYALTGLHGLHVALGAVLLTILFIRAIYGHYSPEKHVSVSTVSMYWHFVDIVWVFLVVVLYVGAIV
ncbi:cox-type terminal oxidase subunit III [Natronomonas pharaonis DSM 2160]|uniref:Cox-type terminal oxidase subunit III n=1 Tax=Natronomonas pharaonis (strain ATCC 35678 / DSM 2160 / CIP 103997 / JCM 8858 / NBRC 14720 / NCIMB 2260 / Gabara) TaxID=348780 RepID=A0A1U7EW66_NATPD|nr:heme-copper oxidase subunit III [Natronomonas pharaonis]CAI49316.1 cox-type terminal oxidase subunit III [Natronomonas pharaonis DSM 2160]